MLTASSRVVIKEPGARDFPRLLQVWPPATFIENRRKIEPKEIPSCLIPRLLVVFTQQLEILKTTLLFPFLFPLFFICLLFHSSHTFFLHQLRAWHKLIVLVTCFKSYFPLLWDLVIYDNEFKTKGNTISTKDKIEPQHTHGGETRSFNN